MKITVGKLKKLIKEVVDGQRVPQRGDQVVYGYDGQVEYGHTVSRVEGDEVWVHAGFGIPLERLHWDEKSKSWVDNKVKEVERKNSKQDKALSKQDKMILKVLTNAATSTTSIREVPNFRIKVLKRGIRYVEDRVNIEGFISAEDINRIKMSVVDFAKWMFDHGATKLVERRPKNLSGSA